MIGIKIPKDGEEYEFYEYRKFKKNKPTVEEMTEIFNTYKDCNITFMQELAE